MTAEFSEIPVVWVCVGVFILSTAVMASQPIAHTWVAKGIATTWALASVYVLYEGGWKQDG